MGNKAQKENPQLKQNFNMSQLKHQTNRSVAWSSVETFANRGLQLLLSIIIARVVAPNEYGLIAMLSIFIALAQSIIDSGFGSALIQKQNRDSRDFSMVFFFNLAISLLIYALLYFGAPLIASFYHQAELVDITRIVGLSLIINAAGIIQRTMLTIDLNFKKIAIITIIAMIISGGVGITMAYSGYGVWALVGQTLSLSAVTTLLYWMSSKWIPRFEWNKSSFRSLFGFGSKILLSGILHTGYINLYNLVIGRVYNASALGFYNRSFTLSQVPTTTISGMLTKVLYPVLCSVQNDKETLEKSFGNYLRMACFIIFPLSLALAAIAEPLIELVLTAKWLESAPLLQLLCVAFMWYPISTINNNLQNACGRSDLFFKAEIIKKAVALAILFASLPFGLIWICFGQIIYNITDVTITIHYTKKVIDVSYIKQFNQLWRILLSACVMAALMHGSTLLIESTSLAVICASLLGVVVYLGMLKILKVRELNTFTKFFSSLRGKN